MYYAVVAATLLVLPVLSMLFDARGGGHWLDPVLAAKWFTFWAVGVRLFLAGIRQSLQPRYTANTLLGIKSEESLVLVRELGFANLAMGTIGLLSLLRPGWVTVAALAGGIYYGLAGIGHIFHNTRNRLENVAMVTDLLIAVLLLCLVFAIR